MNFRNGLLHIRGLSTFRFFLSEMLMNRVPSLIPKSIEKNCPTQGPKQVWLEATKHIPCLCIGVQGKDVRLPEILLEAMWRLCLVNWLPSLQHIPKCDMGWRSGKNLRLLSYFTADIFIFVWFLSSSSWTNKKLYYLSKSR